MNLPLLNPLQETWANLAPRERNLILTGLLILIRAEAGWAYLLNRDR
ncbi:MAG: hypothetical protein Q8M09_18755 [Pseudomonadota bacterium]|nr:hypothetical protein [Pseudomonadota bacterium]MDP1906256.1 hypothetical protein [Pseudomonadota bacterium]MDP2353802.1 hypothetical protein [Pseudomonadota bacterium]